MCGNPRTLVGGKLRWVGSVDRRRRASFRLCTCHFSLLCVLCLRCVLGLCLCWAAVFGLSLGLSQNELGNFVATPDSVGIAESVEI